MNLHEYQAKSLLARQGVPVPEGLVAESADEARAAAVRLGGRVRFFPAQESVLSALASRMSVAAASGCYNEVAQIHKVSRHPLSLRLVLEDMLMRYARAIAGARG